jgi:hypothetical protein
VRSFAGIVAILPRQIKPAGRARAGWPSSTPPDVSHLSLYSYCQVVINGEKSHAHIIPDELVPPGRTAAAYR